MTKIYLLMAMFVVRSLFFVLCCLLLISNQKPATGNQRTTNNQPPTQGMPPVPDVLPQNRHDFRSNSMSISSMESASVRYLVYIPGQNPQTLAQVRLYQPDAFVSQYQGRTVIQIGVFANRNNAQRLARELELGGIRTAIARLKQPASNVAPAWSNPPVASGYNLAPVNNSQAMPPIGTSFSSLPAPSPAGVSQTARGYFLVIPGNRQDLPRMIQTAIDAGISGVEIVTREAPFGPHILLGPFPDRTTAQQESGYLQKFGLNARIHLINN